MTSSSWW